MALNILFPVINYLHNYIKKKKAINIIQYELGHKMKEIEAEDMIKLTEKYPQFEKQFIIFYQSYKAKLGMFHFLDVMEKKVKQILEDLKEEEDFRKKLDSKI